MLNYYIWVRYKLCHAKCFSSFEKIITTNYLIANSISIYYYIVTFISNDSCEQYYVIQFQGVIELITNNTLAFKFHILLQFIGLIYPLGNDLR